MKSRWLAIILVLVLADFTLAQETRPLPLAPEMQAFVTQKLAEDLKDAVLKLSALVQARPKVLERRQDDFALAKLGLEKTRILLERYAEDEIRNRTAREDLDSARQDLDSARQRLDLLAKDQPFPPDPPGLVEKAYLSEIDDSAQPYYLYRPANLDPKKPVPLLLFLHGYVGYLDKATWLKQTFPEEFLKVADQTNAVVLVPFARSNTDFQGIGEKDVLDTITRTLASTPADPDRVFLAGVSMGGSGVWTVATHNPDLFAGAFPIAGRTDYYLWKNLKRDDVPRFERFLIDKEFSITFPQNFVNLPVRCYHTAQDILVSVDHSRTMQRALERLHAPIYYKEYAEGNHWDWEQVFTDAGLIRWIRSTRRDPFPDTVRFATLELRHNHAYWLTIDRIDRWGTPAEVAAARVDRGRIRVAATNVAELTLHLDRKQMRLASQVTIVLNGKERVVDLVDTKDEKFILTEPGKITKRSGLCGPFYELLEHRFILVCPSKGNPDALKRDQTLWAKFVVDWQAFSTGFPRLQYDTALSEKDIADCNLILFGTPETNAFLARIADKLPVKFADGQYVLGKNTLPDKLGLVLIYPNPLNPNRMIAVCSGLHYGEKLSVNHKYDLVPDYVIFEESPDADGTNWFRCAGLFDSNWQLDEALTETRGPPPQPAPAPGLVPQQVPEK